MDHHALYPYDPSDPRFTYYADAIMWPPLPHTTEPSEEHLDANSATAHSRPDAPPSSQSIHHYPHQMPSSNWNLDAAHLNQQQPQQQQQQSSQQQQQQQQQHNMFQHANPYQQHQQSYHQPYQQPLQPSSLGFIQLSQQPAANSNSYMTSAGDMPMVPPAYSNPLEHVANNPLSFFPNDLNDGLADYPIHPQVHTGPFTNAAPLSSSPNDSFPDSHSSTSSEPEWHVVDYPPPRHTFNPYNDMPHPPVVSNPRQNLQLYSESDPFPPEQPSPSASLGSFEDVPFPVPSPRLDHKFEPIAARSPDGDAPTTSRQSKRDSKNQVSPVISHSSHHSSHPSQSSTTSSSGGSISSTAVSAAGSPPPRQKHSPTSKVVKSAPKKPAPSAALRKEPGAPRRVGKRKGPLPPDQRERAGQIRKLGACLRCKCLKKTCDPGDPCAGCKPHHVRNWVVPCTRIDVKDIGYFMKEWKADYERHATLTLSIANIVGYSDVEHPLWVTHGFGFVLPINAREVQVRDTSCFNVDWVESPDDEPRLFDVPTARLSAGKDGVSLTILSEYLDRHIDYGFERFVREHFDGTKFLTDLLITAFKYHERTKLPIVKKALKLVLAYNLTMHITLLEGLSEEDGIVGKIEDQDSKYYGKTLCPVMINFQIKVALAKIWRDLQKDVLDELSKLYTGVYSGDKLKNWPTIFVLASLLLTVWEEMQFDAQYREPNPDVSGKFCRDMEDVPVGVIVGLFAAVSQKLPAFNEWDTQAHHAILNSNGPACEVMTQVRENVIKHEEYLKDRGSCKFDRDDFDSLSNKFLSKLVIRAN